MSPNIRESLIARKLLFADLFTTENVEFLDKDGNPMVRYLTWCNDIEGFIESISEIEKEDWRSKKNIVGIDFGKTSLKITLSLINQNGNSSKKIKDTSVKKMKILALVRDVPENHHNIDILFNLTGLRKILAKYSVDCKLINILLGIQGAQSTFPCPFGECYLDDNGEWVVERIRTIQNLIEHHKSKEAEELKLILFM